MYIATCFGPFWPSSRNTFFHSPFCFTAISPYTGQCITRGKGCTEKQYFRKRSFGAAMLGLRILDKMTSGTQHAKE
jgi:hypothetical protein